MCNDKFQPDRFKEVAREREADDDEDRFNARLKKLRKLKAKIDAKDD